MGTVSVARPVIPPLFGPGPAAHEAGSDAPAVTASGPAEVPATAPAPAPPVVADAAPRSVPALFSAHAETASLPPLPPRSEPQVATSDALERPRAAPLATADSPVPPSRGRAPNSTEAAPPPVNGSVRAPVEPLTPAAGTRPVRARTLRPAEAALPAHGRTAERLGNTSAEQAPVVVVTIGRIEVRATTPAAPPRPQAPRKPAAVSLEDYLQPRRRNR